MGAPHGSFAEYAVSDAHTTFHLPKKTSFEGMHPSAHCVLPVRQSNRVKTFSSARWSPFSHHNVAFSACSCSKNHMTVAISWYGNELEPQDVSTSVFQNSSPNSFRPTEAATLPLAAMTAAYGLYERLSLPLPWHPITTPLPLIIYGAAGAVGSFTIQFAQLSNIHPLICVAGNGIPHVESLISAEKGDVVLDYRNGNEQLVKDMKNVVDKFGGKIEYAFDCICEHGSYQSICQVLSRDKGLITLILPGKNYDDIPAEIEKNITFVGAAHKETDRDKLEEKAGTKAGGEEFAFVMFRFIGRGLQEGWFKGHPYEVVPGGLAGVEDGLRRLKEGKVSAKKLVFRIEDTKGVERYATNYTVKKSSQW